LGSERTLLQWVNLVVIPHLGSSDSRITHALAFWPSSMSLRSRGLHSRRGHSAIFQIVGNLVLVPHEGWIDLSAPALRPCGLRPCRSLPSGFIPAGDILRYARSCGLFDVAPLPRAPFPPKTIRHKTFFVAKPMQSFMRQILLQTLPPLGFHLCAK
jgi:hypothetical protein